MFLTAIAIISKPKSLALINKILLKKSIDEELIKVSLRDAPLNPHPPPGADNIVSFRN